MALSNNDIFKKLRVALKLRDVDIVAICKLDEDIHARASRIYFLEHKIL